jgi:hypothetical protein
MGRVSGFRRVEIGRAARDEGAVAMDWWGWLLIAIAAVLIISFLVALPDARRYLRIRRM